MRAALEASGLDHGPISVHDKMHAMGLDPVPSVASLARIFRQAGVARLEPKKKPRSAWRRFVYPAPNACWQLDATEYVLTGGRKCVIFQLIDDHSRYAVASHVAWGETAEAAIVVFDKAVAAHGVPQRLLSDNGLALNPSRRGYLGQLVEHVIAPGRGGDHRQAVQADHPGQERTLPPDPVPLPRQAAARRHARPNCRPRSTRSTTSTTPSAPTRDYPAASHPTTAWEATPKAEAPRPKPDRAVPSPGPPSTRDPRTVPVRPTRRHPRQEADHRRHVHAGQGHTTRSTDGARLEQVLVITDGDKITVADLRRRDPHRAHPTRTRDRPTSATADPAAHAPRPPKRHRSPETPTVTDVLTQNCHPCPETSHPRCRWSRLDSNTCSRKWMTWTRRRHSPRRHPGGGPRTVAEAQAARAGRALGGPARGAAGHRGRPDRGARDGAAGPAGRRGHPGGRRVRPGRARRRTEAVVVRGACLVGDALELRHRLPRLWARVAAGTLPRGGPGRSPSTPRPSPPRRRPGWTTSWSASRTRSA